jgi:thiol-disulfide isomerase/thioredoxin
MTVVVLGVAARPQAETIPAENISAVSPDQIHELIAENRGNVVIVNFWASWCPPCIEEFPDIIRVYDELHSEGLEVIAVSMNLDDELADIEDFLSNFDPPFPIYRAATYDDAFFQGVSDNWFGEMPTTFIVDTGGEAVRLYKRQLTYEELALDVAALLPATEAADNQ